MRALGRCMGAPQTYKASQLIFPGLSLILVSATMSAEKSPVTLPVILLVAAAALLLHAPPAEGSYMTVWNGPGCSNSAQRYSACGCSNINLHGGYQFVYQGQTAATYNQANCRGVAHTRFGGSVRDCRPMGWQSIFIQC